MARPDVFWAMATVFDLSGCVRRFDPVAHVALLDSIRAQGLRGRTPIRVRRVPGLDGTHTLHVIDGGLRVGAAMWILTQELSHVMVPYVIVTGGK